MCRFIGLAAKLILLACCCPLISTMAYAEEPPPLVYKQAGTLPIILSAPHGGKLEVTGVPARAGEEQAKGAGKFVLTRDTGTEELAHALSVAIEKRWGKGKKPYVVISRAHRKYLDPNRPAQMAYEDPDAKPVYDDYHNALAGYCKVVQKQFRQGLLLDLHGQGTAANTVYRGTQNGKTVTLLRERYGETAHVGGTSLLGLLKTRGWTVFPDPFGGPEHTGYLGGYIVQTYGGNRGLGIDAVQLEFGQEYRTAESREKTVTILADALADYSTRYLDSPPARKSADEAAR
ncbi:MAG: hypothetical protein JWM11_7154 [Planctomycetaceae bacterium]|nr:hypothetical protein [Planctomycetaceae bacterium]